VGLLTSDACGLWTEGKEALAIYDFEARTSRELSFHKGDVLFLYEKVSSDWWDGATANGQKGLIADKYILVRHRCVQDVQVKIIILAKVKVVNRRRLNTGNHFVYVCVHIIVIHNAWR